jgi:hypothetical protein
VSEIIPALTEAAWRDKHDEIVERHPDLQRSGFVFAYGRTRFEREYGTDYQRPGWFARFLAFLYRLLPKIGPLKPLSFKTPDLRAEALFVDSFRETVTRLRNAARETADRRFEFANTNFDTGRAARHGDYSLADDTYAELLRRLSRKHDGHGGQIPSGLAGNVRAFYGLHPQPSSSSREERKHWKEIDRALMLITAQRP